MNESQSWRRGFAAGLAVLALSVAGHLATAGSPGSARETCPLSRGRLAARVTPHVEGRGIAQRVARAVLGAVFHSCS